MMGFEAAAWTNTQRDLRGLEYFAAWYIATEIDDETGVAILLDGTLPVQWHMTNDEVAAVLSSLVDKGFLVIGERERSEGPRTRDVYVAKRYLEATGRSMREALREISARPASRRKG